VFWKCHLILPVSMSSDDAVGEVVAFAVVADEVGRRLAGAPADQVERGS
jgi:hypothetical protein